MFFILVNFLMFSTKLSSYFPFLYYVEDTIEVINEFWDVETCYDSNEIFYFSDICDNVCSKGSSRVTFISSTTIDDVTTSTTESFKNYTETVSSLENTTLGKTISSNTFTLSSITTEFATKLSTNEIVIIEDLIESITPGSGDLNTNKTSTISEGNLDVSTVDDTTEFKISTEETFDTNKVMTTTTAEDIFDTSTVDDTTEFKISTEETFNTDKIMTTIAVEGTSDVFTINDTTEFKISTEESLTTAAEETFDASTVDDTKEFNISTEESFNTDKIMTTTAAEGTSDVFTMNGTTEFKIFTEESLTTAAEETSAASTVDDSTEFKIEETSDATTVVDSTTKLNRRFLDYPIDFQKTKIPKSKLNTTAPTSPASGTTSTTTELPFLPPSPIKCRKGKCVPNRRKCDDLCTYC